MAGRRSDESVLAGSRIERLIAAARKLPFDSPAYLAAAFGRLRLEAGTAPDAAAKELDGVLERSQTRNAEIIPESFPRPTHENRRQSG